MHPMMRGLPTSKNKEDNLKFSDFMFWRNAQKKRTAIYEAGASGGQISQANMKNFVVKAVGFQGENQNNDFASPDYDLSEIKDAINGDSYIKMAIAKYSQLIFKAGYNITSQNDAGAEYLRGRLRMMSFMTSTPMDVLFQQTTDDLVAYSNAFWIKSRQPMTNIGGLTAKGVLDSNPVCGYFRVDPSTMKIKRDKSGTIKQYQQESGQNKKAFKPTDVIHFYIDKPGGAAFGIPRINAALEDVKLLRKIEGNVLNLIYRFAVPIYQMKVGLPQAGYNATDKEITEAKSEVEKMASDGILVTNEKTEFKSLGAEGTALDASGYLNYFEKRVFTALNMSEAMMGRGGSKSDADSMEEQVHDTVKYIQSRFAIFIQEMVFNELLLEGGYNPIINEQDIALFQFNEINNETRVKMETHFLNQFQGNAITFEEMRQRTGMRADSVDESRLFANMIQQPNAIGLIQAKTASTGSGDSPGKDPKAKDNSGTIKNTMQPQNQNGKSSAHIKEMTESVDTTTTDKNVSDYKKNFAKVYKRYNTVRNDVCERNGKAASILPIAREGITKELREYVSSEAQAGILKAVKDSKQKEVSLRKLPLVLIDSKIEEISKGIFTDISKRLKSATDRHEREAVFEALEYRLRFLTDHIVSKAYWYAYVKTCEQLGIEKVYVNFGKSEDKKDHDSIVDTKRFSLDDIPPYHAYCTCRVGMRKD